MFEKDPLKRPSPSEILKSSFMMDLSSLDIAPKKKSLGLDISKILAMGLFKLVNYKQKVKVEVRRNPEN